MERRQAIAWAGSIALLGCVSALLLGSLAGGFGFHDAQAPQTQAIGPRPQPSPIQQRPEPNSTQPLPVPSDPAPEVVPNDPGVASANPAASPAPKPVLDVEQYPHAAAGYAESSMVFPVLPLFQPSATAGWRNIPAPPRDADKPDDPEEKKAPFPTLKKPPVFELPMVEPSKRVMKDFPPQDVEEWFARAKMGAGRSPGADNGASVFDRLTDAGTKVAAQDRTPRGRNHRPND